MTEPITQNDPQSVRELHELYCQCTRQNLSLRFDRERLWYEFLRAGFNAADLSRVIAYLQKEIRAARRNIGALKLSNLLQLDRFEEDLNISRMRLKAPAQRSDPTPKPTLLPLIDKSNATGSSKTLGTFVSSCVVAPPLLNPRRQNLQRRKVPRLPAPSRQQSENPSQLI